jgi:hypothetical protein
MARGKAVIADALIAAPALDLSVLAERNRSIGWRRPGFAVAAMIDAGTAHRGAVGKTRVGPQGQCSGEKDEASRRKKKGAHESPFRHWIDDPP